MIPAPQVIQGLVDPVDMARLKAFVEHAYAEAERSPDHEVQTALEWGGLAITKLRPAVDEFVLPIVEAVVRQFPGARLVQEVSVFRRVVRKTYIYWHMDADGTGSWRYDPLFNCWMPLENVGAGYPSLEVITNSEPLMRRVGINPPGHRSDEWVAENCPKPEVLCPAMRPGDALIFSHFMLHRTQPLDVLAGPRIGCEMRFAMPPDVPRTRWWERYTRLFKPDVDDYPA